MKTRKYTPDFADNLIKDAEVIIKFDTKFASAIAMFIITVVSFKKRSEQSFIKEIEKGFFRIQQAMKKRHKPPCEFLGLLHDIKRHLVYMSENQALTVLEHKKIMNKFKEYLIPSQRMNVFLCEELNIHLDFEQNIGGGVSQRRKNTFILSGKNVVLDDLRRALIKHYKEIGAGSVEINNGREYLGRCPSHAFVFRGKKKLCEIKKAYNKLHIKII